MKSWIRLMARLYPKSWRQRYGAEFDALLDDAKPTWRDGFDVLRRALDMHMKAWNFPKLAVSAVCGVRSLRWESHFGRRANTSRRLFSE